jgi:hypothetical protein
VSVDTGCRCCEVRLKRWAGVAPSASVGAVAICAKNLWILWSRWTRTRVSVETLAVVAYALAVGARNQRFPCANDQ